MIKRATTTGPFPPWAWLHPIELAGHCSKQNPPSFLALLILFIVTKDLHFQKKKNQTTKYILLFCLNMKVPKERPSLPYLSGKHMGPTHCLRNRGSWDIFNWALRERELWLYQSLSPDGNDQNLCLSSSKSTIRKKKPKTLLLCQPNQENAKLYMQKECFMKNFALRRFDALCYKYIKAILCKWVKPCKYFIAEYERCTTRNGVDVETFMF